MSAHALLLFAAILVAQTPDATPREMARSPTDAGTGTERFDVSDGALTPLSRSADGRFVVRGALKREPQASANGRFQRRTSTVPIDDRSTTADPQSNHRLAQ
jgi:hypothetical protein